MTEPHIVPSGQLPSIHHVALMARDLDAMEEFYTRVLGCRAAARWDELGIRFLQASNLQIELIRQESPVGSPPLLDRGLGLNHLALAVDDLDSEYLRLTKAGAEPLSPPELYNRLRIAFLSDIEGNVIELVQADPVE